MCLVCECSTGLCAKLIALRFSHNKWVVAGRLKYNSENKELSNNNFAAMVAIARYLDLVLNRALTCYFQSEFEFDNIINSNQSESEQVVSYRIK